MPDSTRYAPNCDVFLLGSYPYKNPEKTVRKILRLHSLLPHWPQLPKLSAKEKPVEQTLTAIQTSDGRFPKGHAQGWTFALRTIRRREKDVFKTQLMGPITLFQRARKKPARTKLLQLVSLWMRHAFWQIDQVRDAGHRVLIVLDEPLLPGSTARATKLLRSITLRLRKRKALVGIHCCNRISPRLLIETGADLVHFDAFHFATMVTESRSALQEFLKDGGVVAWGLIPTSETLNSATETKIEKRFSEILTSLTASGRDGLTLKRLLAQSMIAATCGMESCTPAEADRALDFAVAFSKRIKKRYGL